MTILFKNDWLKHPGAIVHYSTKNTSFLRLAEILHRMGVENSIFHLSLLDKDLEHIDPYSPSLTLVQKAKVMKECKRNFWYYLREIERIKEPGSVDAVPFNANRMNIGLYWLYFNHITTIAVILRQTGKTTTISALAKYLLNFGGMNIFINLLTKSEGLKADTLNKIKAMYEELPDYANLSTKKDIFNSEEIWIKDLENKFKGNLSSASAKLAEKVGRGFTSATNLLDEVAYIENIAIAMGAMLMSGNHARAIAEAKNKPYGTVMLTTAGDTDDRDGGYIFRLITGSTTWSEVFYDTANTIEVKEIIYKNSAANSNIANKQPIVNITMSYRQLGLSEEWLRKTLEANISTPENLKRDLFNQWLSGNSKSPIDKKYIELLNDNAVEPLKTAFFPPHNVLLRWYITEEEFNQRTKNGSHFVIGVDTSDGNGGNCDDISFVVRDHVVGDIVCTTIFNEINLITLAEFFANFLIKYPQTTMIIERKSSAAAIIDHICLKLRANNINPFTRLYNTVFQNKDSKPGDYLEVSRARMHDDAIFNKFKKCIGFATSGTGVTSRSDLYSTTLNHMLKYTSAITRDVTIVRQISSLVVINNRLDHPSGGNDDMVIAALLSYWLLINGKNLGLYGIQSNLVMRENSVYLTDKYKTDEDSMVKEELAARESEFNSLVDKLKAERDETIARQIECKIRKLATETKLSSNVVSVEELLLDISRNRRLNKYRR